MFKLIKNFNHLLKINKKRIFNVIWLETINNLPPKSDGFKRWAYYYKIKKNYYQTYVHST